MDPGGSGGTSPQINPVCNPAVEMQMLICRAWLMLNYSKIQNSRHGLFGFYYLFKNVLFMDFDMCLDLHLTSPSNKTS